MPNAIHDVVWGSLTLKQLLGSGYNVNGEPIEGVYSGGIDVSEHFGGPIEPTAPFEVEDIGGVLAVSSIVTVGLAVTSGTITVPLKKRQDLGTYAGAGANYSLSSANGILIPDTFSVSENGNASASLTGHFKSTDGDTNPVTVNVAQNVAAEAFNSLWGLGAVTINGTAIPKVLGFTVGTGIRLTKRFYGKNYPTDTFIEARRPFIDVRTYDMDILSALGSALAAGTSLVAYMRKRSGFGTGFVSDVTAAHAKFTFADGAIKPQEWNAGGTGDATRTIRFWGESLTATLAAIT
jgi:hypothetical protein